MTRDDFFDDVHRTRKRGERRRRYFSCQTRFVVIEQTAVLDNRLGDRIQTFRKFIERDFLATSNASDQSKVSRGQQTDVLRILSVDLFNAFRDDQLNARPLLSVRRGLPRRPTAFR